jgi:hypothetical protein
LDHSSSPDWQGKVKRAKTESDDEEDAGALF